MEEIRDYLFVQSGKSWWLKITTADQLLDYMKKTNNRYEGALELLQSKDWQFLYAAILRARRIEGNIFDGFRALNMEVGANRLEDIHRYGAIYINPVGGHTFNLKYKNFVHRPTLSFPNFSLSDIRVKKFNGGQHYYAYVGDVQVRDGDTLKWNTHEEAYHRAKEVVLCD